MLSWTAFFYLSEWIIRVVMLAVVPHRRQPATALVWLLIIFFEPWIGLPLYLVFAGAKLPRRRIARHARLMDRMRDMRRRLAGAPQAIYPTLGPRQTVAVHLARKLGELPILDGNTAELMADTDETIQRIIADIDAATHHVHLLFYIFRNDATGRRVADALCAAAARGVACRVLVDAVGSHRMLRDLASKLRAAGVHVHAALPVGLFRRRVARLDLRNHRKIVVVDGRVAYTGSQNIVDANYGRRRLIWRDMMMRLCGPIVLELQVVFLTDWFYETREILDGEDVLPRPELPGELALQVLPSGPNYPTQNYHSMAVSAIYAAERSVTIVTPYFIPDDALLAAMQTAVARGVNVTLMMPERLDQVTVHAAARSYFEDLLDAGVHVRLYTEALLHGKALVIDDDLAFFGSSNFDLRSFALDFEITVVLYGADATADLRAQVERYRRYTRLLTSAEWQQRPFYRRILQNVARLFSPLL